MQLDYTINSIDERKKVVEEVLQKETKPNLDKLADYLIMCMKKEEKKEKNILTLNRQTTIDKRETSFEGLVDKLENGENAIYHIAKNDKNQLFQPKKPITKTDYDLYPPLRQVKEAIDILKRQTATGRQGYIIKKTLIELYQELYLIKKQMRPPVTPSNRIHSKFAQEIEGFSLSDPLVIEALLCNYSKLRQDSWDKMNSDLWAIMMSLDNLLDKALSKNQYYETIVRMKIDGKTNTEIQEELQLTLGLHPTTEYISTLWRNRIPKYIADFAAKSYLEWFYTYKRKGNWKKCSCCKEYKLASPIYFSKNKSSKDGLYSICKDCRNKK